jgi:hypothetical protein
MKHVLHCLYHNLDQQEGLKLKLPSIFFPFNREMNEDLLVKPPIELSFKVTLLLIQALTVLA